MDNKSKQWWLEKATRFYIGICMFYNRSVVIESRQQIKGSTKWCLKMHEWVLGKDGEFYYEPTPSSRSDAFVQMTRFDSPNEAHTCWVEKVTEAKSLFMYGTKEFDY